MARSLTVSGHPVPPYRLVTLTVPGTKTLLRPGGRKITAEFYIAPLFVDFLARWQKHPALGGGRLSLKGTGPVDSYANRPARQAGGKASDHNGYAIDVLYNILKPDYKEHMTNAENEAVCELLQDYSGALSWGGPTASASKSNPGGSVGKYNRLIDEMHFYGSDGYGRSEFEAVARRLGIRADGTRKPVTVQRPPVGPALSKNDKPTKGLRGKVFSLNYESGGIALKNLRYGKKNDDVRALQECLGMGIQDGLYGPVTRARVRLLQTKLRMPVSLRSGNYDPLTARFVQAHQIRIGEIGDAADGIIGPKQAKALLG